MVLFLSAKDLKSLGVTSFVVICINIRRQSHTNNVCDSIYAIHRNFLENSTSRTAMV